MLQFTVEQHAILVGEIWNSRGGFRGIPQRFHSIPLLNDLQFNCSLTFMRCTLDLEG